MRAIETFLLVLGFSALFVAIGLSDRDVKRKAEIIKNQEGMVREALFLEASITDRMDELEYLFHALRDRESTRAKMDAATQNEILNKIKEVEAQIADLQAIPLIEYWGYVDEGIMPEINWESNPYGGIEDLNTN